jgi:hypothetical protein
MDGHAWQQWEIAELEKLKKGEPFEEVVKALPHRTEKALRLKAFKMGYAPKMHVWVEWEDQIIRDNFPVKTAREIASMLDDRSKYAVQQRIGQLGIQGEQWACTHSANNEFFKSQTFSILIGLVLLLPTSALYSIKTALL